MRLSGLSPAAIWLLLISAVFTLSIGLSNTFVNIYLWKIDHSYVAIGWYNFCVYCLMPISFIAAGALAKRRHPVWTLRLGVVLHAVFYALVLIGGRRLAAWPAVPGAVLGVAAGFYWLSFNLLSLQGTGRGRRDKFFGMNGAVSAIAGMIAPPVAGFLISAEDRFGGLSGYHIVFALSLGLFALATLLSFRLPSGTVGGTLCARAALRQLRSKQAWRWTLTACAVYGLREGVFLFLIGLLYYVATRSEWKLGEFLLLQSALSSLVFFGVGRIATLRNRLAILGVGACGMAAAALLFLRPLTAALILVYGSAIAVFLPLFLVPLQGIVFDRIAALDPSGSTHAEHVIVREVAENAGRVAGIGAFLALASWRPLTSTFSSLAVGLGFVQLLSWGFLRLAQRADTAHSDEPRGGSLQTVQSDAPDIRSRASLRRPPTTPGGEHTLMRRAGGQASTDGTTTRPEGTRPSCWIGNCSEMERVNTRMITRQSRRNYNMRLRIATFGKMPGSSR